MRAARSLIGTLSVLAWLVSAATPARAAIGTCDAASLVEVEATAGTLGPTGYTTLGAAFAAVNAGTHRGVVNVEICGSTSETGSVVLNGSGAGSASYTSLLVRPLVDGATITTATAPGRGVVELNGADNVTIDGDNPNTAGTNRNLTLTNTLTADESYTSVVRLAVNTTNITSTNANTVKNLILNGNAIGRNVSTATSSILSENTTFGILVGGRASTISPTSPPAAVISVTPLVGAGATATAFTANNNQINACARGIAVMGSVETFADQLTISNNVIGDASPSSTTTVYGRGITIQGFDHTTISGNTIRNMAWFVGGPQMGIALGAEATSGTNAVVERNVVSGVNNRATGTFGAYGINANADDNITIRNNVVVGVTGDISGGTAFSTSFGLFGIRLSGGAAHKVYHNSVNMTGVRAGTSSATSLLSASFGITSVALTGIDVRNNLFANTQSGGAANLAYVSVYLPSSGSSDMFLTWNNNAYFSGTNATSQGTAQVGTTPGTGFYLASNFHAGSREGATNLRTYTSSLLAGSTDNDNASHATTAAAPFTSASNLHIPPGTPTFLESFGVGVGVGNDLDGDARNASTPDVGADEFTGVAVDVRPPFIAYTPLAITTSTANRTLTISVTDPSGVPTAGTGRPVLYLRKGTSGAFISSACTFVSAGTYNCLLNHGLLPGGGVAIGDTVQYYVAAQDSAGNVAINPAGGANGLTASPPAAATPPSPPRSYLIAQTLSGVKTVCASGCNYTGLTTANGAFQAISTNVLTGSLTLEIGGDLSGEPGTVALGAWNEEGAGAYGVTIRPSGAPRTITGTGAGFTVLKINGADRVTIDGALTAGGTDRSLTIANTSTATGNAVVWIASLGPGAGAHDVTVKNCVIKGGTVGGTNVTNVGIFAGDTGGTAAGADNDALTIQNNRIFRTTIGIEAIGAATGPNDGTTIVDNTIGDPVVGEAIGRYGILVGHATGATISRNTIRNVVTTDPAVTPSNNATGVLLTTGVVGGAVTRNDVSGVRYAGSGGFGGKGIDVDTGVADSDLTIANNFISDVRGDGWNDLAGNSIVGLRISGTTGGVRVYNNSVHLGSGQDFGNALGTRSAAFYAGAATAGLDVRNNIFASSLDNTAVVSHRTYAVATGAASSAVFTTIDHNDYFVSGPAGTVGLLGGVDRTGLSDWKAASGQDASSKDFDPKFVSATDLHLDTATAPSPVENLGAAIASVTVDLDGNPRGGSPEMGADEADACLGVVCDGSNTACGVASCDPVGLSGNCDTLTPIAAGPVCRPAAGVCDLAESCDGLSTFCPTDGYAAGGECRASTGGCDPAETCDGTSSACPGDVVASAGTECRAPAGGCDLAEVCDGSAVACPDDVVATAGTECRGVAGSCDTAESCDGAAAACPVDAFVASGTECRASAGFCDVAESCTGVAAACPQDAFVSGLECRASTGDCDPAEVCSGSAAVCPDDALATAGSVCRSSTGGCDPAETCDGVATACPADAIATAGTECRVVAGACDVAEICDGASVACPQDGFVASGTECRATAGTCDVAESCTGAAAACPTDGFVASGTECRASAGICDTAESCTGAAAACPNDALATAGTECRAPAGACDVAETCDGVATSCPADGIATAGTQCRAAAGGCDVAEVCDGSALTCPEDVIATAGTECRAVAGSCDVADTCDGTAVACPADGFVGSGTECRASAGICDVAESCTGSAAACPTDGFVASGTECRASAGSCDPAEACSGIAAACPNDALATAGTECHASAGGCDPAESCDGVATACPADAIATAGTECRGAAGSCDVAEICDGAAVACPQDGFVASGTECRVSAGSCDVAESCTGSAAACPTDGFVASGTECRASAGSCDPAEACSGIAAACPNDALATAGTECRASAGGCDPTESCDGVATACPADAIATAGTECRGAAGSCDVAEICDGAAVACPQDGFVASGTECRVSAGSCDVAESCTGSAAACPTDGFVASGTECRASAGLCDVVESCTGTAAACPDDALTTAGTECRASAGACDVAEACDGAVAACPADAIATVGTECRAPTGACDVAEVCDGAAITCPADAIATAGTECRAAAGICDVAESCDGAAVTCPADGFVASGTECRATVGPCDAAESCSGSAAACPADGFATGGECRASTGGCDPAETCDGTSIACPSDAISTVGTVCRAPIGTCDLAETCDGASVVCPEDAIATAGTECRAVAGGCDLAESCDGASGTCPEDTFVDGGTECRSSTGICDLAENCNGSSAACPADSLAPLGTECRASAGICDVPESCTGFAETCPADAFASTGVCRGPAGACDVVESCDGTSVECPADEFAGGGTSCRASAGICDVAESCTGSSAACPTDDFVAGGTQCRASAGICDPAESCTGTQADCPANDFTAAGTECRAAAGICDVAESCTGTQAACPVDALVAAGAQCRASAGACDPVEQCTGQLFFCPGDVTNASNPVGNTVQLVHSKVNVKTTISWTEAESGRFNVYRGAKVGAAPWVYNQGCLASGVIQQSVNDNANPAVTQMFFYLVSRDTTTCNESTLGLDSTGMPRPNAAACAAGFGADTDADGVIDALDNCPAVYNPAQSDVDGDVIGDACDNCPSFWNQDQADADLDGVGDLCE